MRLICPNCSAQYEIDASLIPEDGREVQCSNCGNNWFELPVGDSNAPPPEEVVVETESTEPHEAEPEMPESEVEPDEDRSPPEASPIQDDEDDSWDWPSSRLASQDEEVREVAETNRPRRPADLAALEILKEEADRELAKRRDDVVEPLETQQDLDLEEVRDRETPSRALRARMARLRGEEEEDEDEEAAEDTASEDEAYGAPRKDLLPDIDEINSSLRPAGLAAGQRSEEEEAEHRRGFRLGFVGIVAIAVLMVVVYTQAPAIAGLLPGTETVLIDYVDWANGIRDNVNGLFGG